MKRWLGMLASIALVLAFAFSVSPTHAADGARCYADPISGPPGTKFQISCTGFSPNTTVNAYVVEPDGRAISGAQIVGFGSNVGNGNILTDQEGTASFAWQSQDGTRELTGGGTFAHQLGDWTWVVHQLGAASSVLARGEVRVTLESANWEQVGATLTASASGAAVGDAVTFNFNGSGFWRDEYVNVWVTLPPNCSGRASVEGASADDPYYQGLFDGFFGPNTVKANEKGEIGFAVLFTTAACRGEYSATVYAPGSGYGAIATFQVSGKTIAPSSTRHLIVVPDAVDALNPLLTILGSNWNVNQAVDCWSTRPDGRSFNVGSATADANGNFALDIHISGFDSTAPYASEEPGVWSVTCRAPSNGDTAVTTVTVHALTVDP
ncbi:MAG: hypothetical protein HY741_20210 [Chloroflexi bacterium]|nr:hypothetical protein [Chloroflexota bacterium]